MYECSSELTKQFAHSNRMMYALTGCGQSRGVSDLVGSTDPGPRQGASSTARGGGPPAARMLPPIYAAFDFLRTNLFTIVFLVVFMAGFLHRRKKRRHSSE